MAKLRQLDEPEVDSYILAKVQQLEEQQLGDNFMSENDPETPIPYIESVKFTSPDRSVEDDRKFVPVSSLKFLSQQKKVESQPILEKVSLIESQDEFTKLASQAHFPIEGSINKQTPL